MEVKDTVGDVEKDNRCLINTDSSRKRPTSPDLFDDDAFEFKSEVAVEPRAKKLIKSDSGSDNSIKIENQALNDNSIPGNRDVKCSVQSLMMKTLFENSTKSKINNTESNCSKKEKIMFSNKNELTTTEVITDFYGLPLLVKKLFETHQGINQLYHWQDELLSSPAISERKNLIFSLPTSGGKTLIAEILLLRELLLYNRDAILILPYVAIVQEKVRELSPFAIALDFVIEEYASSKGQFPPKQKRKRRSIYVATIEKAHSLINSLIENKRLEEIGLIIVDELHMLGENRGAVLECTLSKILFLDVGIQIVGMSATLDNVEELAKFLHAIIYKGNFRPVELKEYVKVGENILEIDQKAVDIEEKFLFTRKFIFNKYPSPSVKAKDPDQLTGLVLEVIPQNSCLIFCASKKNCENVAMLICEGLPRDLMQTKANEKKQLLQDLKYDGKLCRVLRATIPFGVAYHHSGLTMDERRLLEEAYANNILCCLTCTSTLAAGINLPAKRVILRAPYVGRDFLTRNRYKQMVGRAGRAGIDSSGESVLIINPSDREKVVDLFAQYEENCLSNLLLDGEKGLKSLILSLIGLGISKTIMDIDKFLSMTLLAVQQKHFDVNLISVRDETLKALIQSGLVKAVYDQSNRTIENAILMATDLGRATFKGSIDVDIASKLESSLLIGLNGLHLHNYLHLLYLVTPYESMSGVKTDPIIYRAKYLLLSDDDRRMANSIGISMAAVLKVSFEEKFSLQDEETFRRFYSCLILYDLWSQQTVWDVANEFQLHRGTVQSLLTNAASFASCVYHFCQELPKLWPYQLLLENFIKQFSHCVSPELLPLMELPAVKKGRAYQLHKNGFKTLHDVAIATSNNLCTAVPLLPRRVATQIIAAAKMLLIQQAEELKDKADDLVEGLHFPETGNNNLIV